MDVEKSPATTTDPTAHINPYTTSSHAAQKPPPRRRRRCLCICLSLIATIFLLALIILILALTIFKKRDPTITVTSISVEGVSPSITFPFITSSFQLNLTLHIGARVHNPNRASFSHGPGTVLISYRTVQIGEADVPGGKIPSRGSEDLTANVTITLQSFVQGDGNLTRKLIGDVVSGEVGMDTDARVPGRVTFLGFVKKHLVAISVCHFVVGFPGLEVKRQVCSNKAKL